MTDRSSGYPNDAALVRLVTGECQPAELRELQRWIEADPAHRARVDELRAIWSARAAPVRWNVDRLWDNVRATMAERPPSPAIVKDTASPRPSAPPTRRAIRVPRVQTAGIAWATAIVFVIVGGTAWALDWHWTTPAQLSPRPMREYVTARGERATLDLADGSRVMLAPESRVRVPADFGTRARDFFLDGEAIFVVVHDSLNPFRVHAKGAIVEDIGTRFDLRAYASDPAVAVVVAEGSVTLSRARAATDTSSAELPDRAVLRSGQLGRLDARGHVTTRHGVPLDAYLGWADGRLVFVDAALPDVLRTIGRWHDLDIRVADARLASRRVTAEFSTQSSDNMLSALAAAVGARLQRMGRVVTLRSAQ